VPKVRHLRRSLLVVMWQHRLGRRLLLGLGALFAVVLIAFCSRGKPVADVPAEEDNVWAFISQEANLHEINPYFVYAMAMAESSLDPLAETHHARGMMQISRAAWQEVAPEIPYREAWNWKTNVQVSLRYLAFCRDFLNDRRGSWSYPLLAACYRYGPYRVQAEAFDLNRLPKPKNLIYQQLFRGNINPVPVPQ